jgi:hypothetical protein
MTKLAGNRQVMALPPFSDPDFPIGPRKILSPIMWSTGRDQEYKRRQIVNDEKDQRRINRLHANGIAKTSNTMEPGLALDGFKIK